MRRVYEVFANPDQTFTLVQDLAHDVWVLCRQDAITTETALYRVLDDWRAKNGFLPALRLTTPNISPLDFYSSLKEGSLYEDTAFTDRPQGAHTHRIQWNLWMRDIQSHPDACAVSGQAIVNPVNLLQSIAQSRSLGRDLWHFLFDSYSQNFTQPDFAREHLLRLIGNWK